MIENFDWTILQDAFFGAVCGYIASRLLGGDGYGCLGNIVVGVIGGVIGVWVVKVAKIPMMDGIVGRFVTAVLGAIVLLAFIEVIKFLQRTNQNSRRSRR
ncbi:MAG: hypothetical protein R2774_11490 [Saprospiraceae bacterium]